MQNIWASAEILEGLNMGFVPAEVREPGLSVVDYLNSLYSTHLVETHLDDLGRVCSLKYNISPFSFTKLLMIQYYLVFRAISITIDAYSNTIIEICPQARKLVDPTEA